MSEFYDDFEDEFGEELEKAFEAQKAKEKSKQRLNFDVLLTIAGLCLAGSSAFLPWYVFFNQDKFSVKRMAYSQDRPLPSSWQGRAIVNASPAAIPGRKTGEIKAPLELPPDALTTASIPDQLGRPNDRDKNRSSNSISQPFPGELRYKLLHVVNDRALIEDSSGMYMVQIGSVLPDNSTLSALEKRGNHWALITSRGDVLEN